MARETQDKKAARKRRHYAARRAEAFAYVGGERCQWCGTTENVTLDHVDRYEKQVACNRFHMVSRERFEAELPKLQALCMSCHAWKSNDERRPSNKRQPLVWSERMQCMAPKDVCEQWERAALGCEEDEEPF